MSLGVRLVLLALTALTMCGPAWGAPPRAPCRHVLATVGSAGDMPYSVVQSVEPWMALHERGSNGPNATPLGHPTADFLWAAESGDRWIVVYADRVTGHSRFALFAPIARNSATYRQLAPARGKPDWFGDLTCRGIDAALDAYARPL